jgi:hypothetical protein
LRRSSVGILRPPPFTPIRSGVIGTFRRQISHIRQPAWEEGWLTLYGDRGPSSGVRRPGPCRCMQATLPWKARDVPGFAIAPPHLVRTISAVRMLGCAIRFGCSLWRLG